MAARTLHPAYIAILEASKAMGWPKRFRSDLTTHDRGAIDRLPPGMPFAWGLRDRGTHLFRADCQDGSGHRSPDFPRFVEGAFGPLATCWFFWDGSRLTPVTVEGAIEGLRAWLDSQSSAGVAGVEGRG